MKQIALRIDYNISNFYEHKERHQRQNLKETVKTHRQESSHIVRTKALLKQN